MSKNVRFSPFVTFLGEPEPTYPDLDDSFRMEGSSASNLFESQGKRNSCSGRRRSSGSSACNKRGSINLADMFAAEKSFGRMALSDGSSGGFSFGFSGSDFNLGDSGNFQPVIQEEDEDTDEGSTNHAEAAGACDSSDLDALSQHQHFGNSSFSSPCLPSAETEDSLSSIIEPSPNDEANSTARTPT